MQAPPVKDGPRINDEIRVPKVLLIDQHGEKQGVMPTSSALEAAEEAGLDLVACLTNLTFYCGANAPTVAPNALGDKCKGHASPYHYHADLPCSYNASQSHSGLVGDRKSVVEGKSVW